MQKHIGGLGKGLGALIPAGSAPVGASVIEIAINDIEPNPHQPRQDTESAALAELAASLREHGVLQPLLVARLEQPAESAAGAGASYRLIAGERRLRAAKMAGLSRVPALVKEATPQEMLELALVENIQRADLNVLEEAEAYRHLVADFGLSQEQVAQRVGKSPATVSNALRLLALPEQVKTALLAGQISEGHARALLSLGSPDAQLAGLREVLNKGYSVRQTEEFVRRTRQGQRVERRNTRSAEVAAAEEEFRRALGTKVELFRSKRGGRLVIHFYSEDELQGIYDHIIR